MTKTLRCFPLIILLLQACASISSEKKTLLNYDFAEAINPDSLILDFNTNAKTKRPKILAFVGKDYMRFELRMMEVFKDSINPSRYRMWGRTRHMGWARTFVGDLFIQDIKLLKNKKGSYSEGVLKANLFLREDSLSQGAAHYEGILTCNFLISEKGKVYYNSLSLNKAEFSNNQFVGKRIPFQKNKEVQTCNWGDFRIPECGDLDIGKERFRPNEKYLNQNWRMYKLILDGNPAWEATKQAIIEENSPF